MKLKNLFAITAIASTLVLTGCKEEKKADAASTAPAPTSIKVGVMAGPEHQVAETAKEMQTASQAFLEPQSEMADKVNDKMEAYKQDKLEEQEKARIMKESK